MFRRIQIQPLVKGLLIALAVFWMAQQAEALLNKAARIEKPAPARINQPPKNLPDSAKQRIPPPAGDFFKRPSRPARQVRIQ